MSNLPLKNALIAAVSVALLSSACSSSTSTQNAADTEPGSNSQSTPAPSIAADAPQASATPEASPSVQASGSPQTQEASSSAAGRVSLEGNQISFVPPPGFTAMTAQEIALKFPRGANPPKYVYANDRRSVAIAVTLSQASLTPEQLPELKQQMESFLEKGLPGLKWLDRGFVDINGVRWVKLEAKSKAIDTDIRNDMYFTSFNGKMLGFNFNSTVEMDTKARNALLKSRDSITLKQ